MNRTRTLLAAAVVALAVAGGATAASTGTTLSLVAYSTPKPVMQKIIQAWQQTPDGNGVSFSQSYGPSTNQAKAVAAGQPADILFLSTGDDMNLDVDAGVVDQSWSRQSYNGIGADTVVVFAVRDGNPKHIKGWADLLKPGVQVVTPNPFSSGSAKWNILAAYGAERKLGKTDKQATSFVQKLMQHVVSQDSSGANALNTFLAGKGDVLLTYESEAYAAVAAGKDVHMVIPKQTMVIELPMVVLKNSSNKATAQQFVEFVHTERAQEIFAQNGYRPVVKAALRKYASRYGGRPVMFRISDPLFGGWRKADKTWFDPSKGRMAKIEANVGGPTGAGG
jgi:sulfate transport system substrate-binding protein